MEPVVEEILARINELLGEDKNRGGQVAHDLVDRLVEKMEALAAERAMLEKKLREAGDNDNARATIVNEIAARLEKTAGRAKVTMEIIDSIIEMLYGIYPENAEDTVSTEKTTD